MKNPDDLKRWFKEMHGYMHNFVHHGTDREGREHALQGFHQLKDMLIHSSDGISLGEWEQIAGLISKLMRRLKDDHEPRSSNSLIIYAKGLRDVADSFDKLAEEKRQDLINRFKIGDKVDYHSVIGGEITSTNHTIENLWQLGHGQWVAKLSDKVGGVSLEALSHCTDREGNNAIEESKVVQ